MNLSHGPSIFVTFLNFSATLKSQLSLLYGLNHCINTVLLSRIRAARKADGGWDCHCDVINDVPFLLYLTLMTSNVRYASKLNDSWPFRRESQHRAWDKWRYSSTADHLRIYYVPWNMPIVFCIFYTPASTKLKGGYTGFTLSIRLPSLHPSVCPSVDTSGFTVYLQQYLLDPFHICTSYQVTSEGVSHVKFVAKFKHLQFWQIL